ncbi:MAG: TonB-dependent receptor [Planctomycetota bacterium]
MHRFLLLLLLSSLARAETVEKAVNAYFAALAEAEEEEGGAGGPLPLDKVVVTATREEERQIDVPYTTAEVDAETVERRSYRSTPQVLRNTPGVMVQETSPGQGSPFLRGFTGFRTLFLIDGIRLNNSTFREGPNQYWATVDPLSVARFDIVMGPSSVLYGSDAIGGTVQAITKTPYGYGPGWTAAGLFYTRFASAEDSATGRIEGSIGRDGKTGLLAGFTGRTYGDMVAGQPMGEQPNTGYDEWAADAKLEHFLGENARLVLAYQQVEQNNVPRTHRTTAAKSFHGTAVGTELEHDFDQERLLLYAQLHAQELEGWIDEAHASISWQEQNEVRDRLRTGDRRDKEAVDTGTLGTWFQLGSGVGTTQLTYGFEYYHDNVNSSSTANPVQGPVADEATYDLLGAYLQAMVPLGARWEVVLGGRSTWAAVDADQVFDPTTGLPFALSDDWTKLTGSARVLYRLHPEHWSLFGGASQGFRAPNLSDLTRLDTARTNEFEVPSPGLDSENYLAFELGVKGQGPRFALRCSGFYTIIEDQITRTPTGALTPDGDVIVTKTNVGDGYIYGVELEGSYLIHPQWTLFGGLTAMDGRVDTFATSDPVVTRDYVSRIMPVTTQLGARWNQPQGELWFEVYVLMAAEADHLSPADEGDTQRIPPGGTPGYAVVNLLFGWTFTPKARLVTGIENLFDKSYRVHGSGSNMPGLNALVSFSLDF